MYSVSSVLFENLTETDSISFEGYSLRNNARVSVESMPELRDIPIFLCSEPSSCEMFFLINSSTEFSEFSVDLVSKSSGENFWNELSRFVE